ncbi:MAG: S-layer homology domain-containing protein, partial [Candidatus Limnocylindria bacterium]
MSRLRAISLGIVIVLAGLSTTATAAAPTFDDIATSPFRGDIEWIAARGITGGCDARRYCPNGVVTRGQMASFLARMFDLPPATRDYFRDDNASMHQSAINRLAQSG